MTPPVPKVETTGRWQMALLALIGCNFAITAMNHALPAFHGFTPTFHCQLPDTNSSNYEEGCMSNTTLGQNCTGSYQFTSERHDTSIVTEWELVCDRRLLAPLVATLYFCGVTLGALAGGMAADRFGRRTVMLISLYCQGALGASLYATTSLEAFIAVRFVQGIFVQALQGSTYTLLLELFPASARTAVGVVLEVYWALGLIVLSVSSYLLPDWRSLQLALSVPTALTLLFVCFVPESPCWLSARGRYREATEVWERIARLNGTTNRKTANLQAAAEYEGKKSSLASLSTKPVSVCEKQQKSNSYRETNEYSGCAVNEENNTLEKSEPESCQNTNSSIGVSSELSNGNVKTQESDENVHIDGNRTSSCHSAVHDASDIRSVVDETDSALQEDAVQECKKRTRTDGGSAMPASDVAASGEENCVVSHGTERANCSVKTMRSHGILDLFTNPLLRKFNGVMVLVWFGVTLAYYGIMFYLPALSGNRHLNFVIGAILELVSYGLAYIVLSRFGLRIPQACYLILSGILCAAVGTIGTVHGTDMGTVLSGVQTALALVGKAVVVSGYCTMSLYTFELFPTIVRAAAQGHCGFWGRVGSLLAPQLLILGEYTSQFVPLACMSVIVILGGLATLALPETSGCPLADTIQQTEESYKYRKSIKTSAS